MLLKFFFTLILLILLAFVIETIRYRIYVHKSRKGVFGVKYTTPRTVFNYVKMIKVVIKNIPSLWSK